MVDFERRLATGVARPAYSSRVRGRGAVETAPCFASGQSLNPNLAAEEALLGILVVWIASKGRYSWRVSEDSRVSEDEPALLCKHIEPPGSGRNVTATSCTAERGSVYAPAPATPLPVTRVEPRISKIMASHNPWKSEILDFADNVNLPKARHRELEKALKEGFSAFLRLVDHDKEWASDRARASEAMVELPKQLKTSDGPDYNNSYIVAAYLLLYQLRHCVMAYRAFTELLRFTGIPDTLYVRDFGAGADAGLTGLILALANECAAPTVHFHTIEPSGQMRMAAECFRQRLRTPLNFVLRYSTDSGSPDRARAIPDRSLRIVTAFHLSLPYDPKGNYQFLNADALKNTLNVVKPHAGLFSCHEKKTKSLKSAVCPYFNTREFQSGQCPLPKYGRVENAALYTTTAQRNGFEWSGYEWGHLRFSTPTGAVMLWAVKAKWPPP